MAAVAGTDVERPCAVGHVTHPVCRTVVVDAIKMQATCKSCLKDKRNVRAVSGMCASCHRRIRYKSDKKFRKAVIKWNGEATRKGRLNDPVKYKNFSQRMRFKHVVPNKFGITAGEYYEMLRLQSSLCALCGNLSKMRLLCIDHNHESGAVRGLLCIRCNLHLGIIERYLRKPDTIDKYLRLDGLLTY